MNICIIPRHTFTRVLWKNGQGYTEEIARQDAHDQTGFDWRISIAEVAHDGPFSIFEGYQRNISVLQGRGMTLTVNKRVSPPLTLYQSFAFDGQAATTCVLADGPISDFNVIFNPLRVRASVCWYRFEQTQLLSHPDNGITFVINAEGRTLIGGHDGHSELTSWDVVKLSGNHDELQLTCAGERPSVIGVVTLISDMGNAG